MFKFIKITFTSDVMCECVYTKLFLKVLLVVLKTNKQNYFIAFILRVNYVLWD